MNGLWHVHFQMKKPNLVANPDPGATPGLLDIATLPVKFFAMQGSCVPFSRQCFDSINSDLSDQH